MILFNFYDFRKPVAFYPYTSVVRDYFIKVDTWNDHRDKVSPEQEDLIEYIDHLFDQADELNRKVMDEDLGYCKYSTQRDNKTVLAMSDGERTIYFGKYDGNYYVGFDVWSEFGAVIDLSDLDKLPKSE